MNRMGDKVSDFLMRWSRRLFDEPPPAGSPVGGMSGARLCDHLPYRQWHAAKELYVQRESIGWIIELIPLNGADENVGRTLEELFAHAVPQGSTVQSHCYLSPKIGELTDEWAQVRSGQGGIHLEVAKERREHFRRATWNSASQLAPFYLRDIRIFISMEMPGGIDSHNADVLLEARDKFIADFKAARSGAAVVGPDQLLATVGDILNPTTNVRPTEIKYDPSTHINEQMMRWDTRTTVYRDRLEVQSRAGGDDFIVRDRNWSEEEEVLGRESQGRDEHFITRGFAVRKFPEVWSQGMCQRLLGDMFNDQLRLIGPTLITLCFWPMTAEKSRAIADYKKIRTTQMEGNWLSRMAPEVGKMAQDWRHVHEDVAEGAKLGKLGVFVLSIAPVDQAVKAERQLRSVWRNSRFQLERNDDIHLQTLIAALPLGLGGGMADDLETMGRVQKMPTTVAARLSPFQGEFLGYDVPHLILVGRRGQVMWWSPFGNKEGNHNVAVIGASGSGKSVFMQEVATGIRGAGGLVFVIDDGKSFESSCKLQGGRFVEFRADLKVCMNPFSLIDPEEAAHNEEYRNEGLEAIMLMLEQAARGGRGCSPEEKGVLAEEVQLVWEKLGTAGSFDAVIQGLRKKKHGLRGQDLATSLRSYSKEGVYGGFFNGPATLEIDNPYTVFEMGDLETKKDLRAIVLLGVMFVIRQKMKHGGKALKKVLIVDEAWQLFEDGAMAQFIEGFVRRCRKEGGALVTGTQSLNDYYNSKGAQACFENSDHLVVLRQKPEALDQLKRNERISADDASMTLMKSLKVSPGEYSELFIKGPDARFVARLVLDRYSATLYSTSPATRDAIAKLREANVPLVDAVRRVSEAA